MIKLDAMKIYRVVNGWVLEPYHPDMGPTISVDEIYIFKTMKELCEFLVAQATTQMEE